MNKPLSAHGTLQHPVASRHQPGPNGLDFIRADRLESAFLDGLKELGLERHRQSVDLEELAHVLTSDDDGQR
jgi:hypothetical protein